MCIFHVNHVSNRIIYYIAIKQRLGHVARVGVCTYIIALNIRASFYSPLNVIAGARRYINPPSPRTWTTATTTAFGSVPSVSCELTLSQEKLDLCPV